MDGKELRDQLEGRETVIVPPPGAVVSAAYLVKGIDGPRVWLEICPRCTSRVDDRMCLCRVQCTYERCGHDDPMTKLVTGVGE